MRPPNTSIPSSVMREGRPLDPVEHLGDRVGGPVIDIADEAQRQMVVFRVDPARAGQARRAGR